MRKLLAALLFCTACTPAQADRIGVEGPRQPAVVQRIAIASAPIKVRAPYDVELVAEDGSTLATHALGDRFYVKGNANERYTIRVTNPTANRVEAVITVDGLDVVDGEDGDLRKRGYVVPAYGETRIEGFRTSAADVATFRFSSVDGSYAGKQGKARNVGVVAVAIFEERHDPEQQVIIGDAQGSPQDYDYREDVVGGAAAPPTGVRPEARDRLVTTASRPAPSQPAPPRGGAPRHAEKAAFDDDAADEAQWQPPNQPAPPHTTRRPGLGTQFGEQRYSAASFTRFVRAEGKPVAIAELRYNDAAGLLALGIDVGPMPDAGELMTRETADPFPGDPHYARRPD